MPGGEPRDALGAWGQELLGVMTHNPPCPLPCKTWGQNGAFCKRVLPTLCLGWTLTGAQEPVLFKTRPPDHG